MTQDEPLTSTQEQREEARYAKWSKYVYARKRRIQRQVLALERGIAQNISQFKTYKRLDPLFESHFSFLSCWKFSKVDFGQPTFWCDAIYFDNFGIMNEHTFTFNGHAWIGMINNTCDEWKVPCSGTFTINTNANRLKSYDLYFYDKEQTIHLSRKAKSGKLSSFYTSKNSKHSHSYSLELQ